MIRRIDVFFVLLVLVVVSSTYVLKYGSEIEHDNIAKLNREIKIEREATDILEANWSLLTDPARIQRLTSRYQDELGLEELLPKQVTDLNNIRLRPIVLPEFRNANNQEDGISGLITGSIGQNDDIPANSKDVSNGE